MILLVDIGNTRVKWAALNDGALGEFGDAVRLDREFKEVAKAAWAELEAPERVLVTNVAGPSVKKSANLWMRRRWKTAPEFVEAGAEACGVINAYEKPKKLGPDRWVAMVAARSIVQGPVVVVDCGTAITIDVLSMEGRHLGGLIIPGLGLMARSLIDRAPGIDEPSPDNPGHVALFGRDTDSAVTGGALYGAVALLDRAVSDVMAELGPRVTTIVTGGDAGRIGPLLARSVQYEPHLVLKGLAELARETCVT